MAIAYLVGSIPFGWLMGKLFFKEDIRQATGGFFYFRRKP